MNFFVLFNQIISYPKLLHAYHRHQFHSRLKTRYFLPNINELQNRFGNAKNSIKLNLRTAYNLKYIKNGENWKPIFKNRYGHYEYLVMPFGFINESAI